MSTEHDDGRPGGLAAMSVCEAVMIGLVEKGLLDWEEVSETLEGAIEAHRLAEADGFSAEEHAGAADMIEGLLRKMNALRASGVV